MAILVANIPWPGPGSDDLAIPIIADRLGIASDAVATVTLLRRSVDGRRRPPLWLANYRVTLSADEAGVLGRAIHGVRPYTERDDSRFGQPDAAPPRRSPWPRRVRPIVVGAGPGGLFAALRLGEAGAPAILLDRGGAVEDRHLAVRRFWRHGELNAETNVVFGEGGAGAFSDGKIYTRRRDGDLGEVFRRLVEHGASPEILEEGWAHLGTDRIREILPRIRARLVALGVEVRFDTQVVDLVVEGGRCTGVVLGDGERLAGGPVILATGHSARDTWEMVLRAGASAEARPIHVGARIEHPQRLVDEARYGGSSTEAGLPAASYRLRSHPQRARPAHTFCMCPGGTVVAATNHPERVVVNGMSYSGRRAWWANSAVVVEVRPEDYAGADPLAGVRFQDTIEAAAFRAGGGEFRAPAQLAADLLTGVAGTELPRTSYTLGVTAADLRDVLPAFVIEGMVAALRHFERDIPGFAGPEAVLIAPETRTTAPLRLLRGADRESLGLPDLLPVGEGAGYAGGIASAALDGFRSAQALVERYCPRLA